MNTPETATAALPESQQKVVTASTTPDSVNIGKENPTKDATMPLKEAFKGKFIIGSALNYPELQGKNPDRVAFLQKHFNAITAGNSLKPDFTQRVEGEFTFADSDKLMEIASKSGATVVGHTLVWHSQTPAWFFQGPDGKPADRALALARMRKHIATVVGRYKSRI
ncbi:MAG: endo-1,4-beta-xylanase, partial [Fibrella sp.]|nr:endo-1,4-beta-xylanase [Armatimonadota bacterium]